MKTKRSISKILLAGVVFLSAAGTGLQAYPFGSGTITPGKFVPLPVKRHRSNKIEDAGWYMRIKAYATAENGTVYKHDDAGVFGELKGSCNGKDRHDIPAYGPAIFQVVFPHYHWGEKYSGDYWSDYRQYKKRRRFRSSMWTFQIKNQRGVDLSNARFRVEIDDAKVIKSVRENDGLHYRVSGTDPRIKAQFTLVDVDENRTYRLDELKEIDFSMEGKHIRTFRLIRGSVGILSFEPVLLPWKR
ncbi:hypothetical protein [Nitratifractor sp.]|uniref:hypothetical protein n=1 Tax=Nitratifractor sp. TaxID=2268144 RepID=UPI0025D9295B|nr:hypothetical protein [Nitratifractor sp.]